MLPPIAIVGISCNFPGADDYYHYWKNLCEGTVSCGADESVAADAKYRPEKGKINNPETFEPSRYNISEKEAALMDPQLRKFIELVDDALLDANHPMGKGLGKVSVIASQGTNHTYHNELTKLIATGSIEAPETLIENVNKGADFLATRTAYLFDFTGPCFNLQSACSSSLTAAVEAVYMLQTSRCDAAITGGVNISYPLDEGYSYQAGSIHSKSGVNRPFDAKADGIVPSNGGGVVVLKRLEDALKNGDRIHAVINAAASNNDGNQKVSFAAPSVKGQYELLKDVYQQAGVNPTGLKFIECHATGTVVGDPIEVRSLQQLMMDYIPEERDDKVVLGSVKGNIGHLFWSSGIASLIKTALSLQFGKYPGTANLTEENQLLELNESNMQVSAQATHLSGGKAFAGVSCFGVGGTNSHLVLSRYGSSYLSDQIIWQRNELKNKASQSGKVFTLVKEQAQIVEQSQEQPSVAVSGQVDILENMIALYEDTLGETDLHGNSDYFDYYGDSINAISLIDDIKQHYSLELTQEDIFEQSTPILLTALIKERLAPTTTVAETSTKALVVAEGLNPFQSRFYLLEKLQRGGFSHYNVALCLQIDDEFPKAGFVEALEIILSSMPQFSQQVKWSQQGLALSVPRTRILQTAELEVEDSQELAAALKPVFGHRFRLEKGCTAELTYARQGEQEYCVLNLPHLLIDGTGIDNLLQQAGLLLSGGKKVGKQFMSLEMGLQIDPQSREYWKAAINDYSATELVDSDKLQSGSKDQQCGEQKYRMNTQVFDQIRQVCRIHQTSPFVLLYAVFNYYLASVSGDKRICTGTTLANRDEALQSSIGCYINNIVVPVDCEQANMNTVLTRTKEALQQGMLHANVPLDMVVSDSKRGGRPLYNILFMFQNQNCDYSLSVGDKIYHEADFTYNPLYCDLCVNITPVKGEADVSLTYNTSKYRGDYIDGVFVGFLATLNDCLTVLENAKPC